MSNKLGDDLKIYIPFVEAVVGLFSPFVEAAIHDLQTGKIFALYNNISKRTVRDPSPLHELGVPVEKFPDFFLPYYKTNWDGRKLKCTSITIRNKEKKPIALICLNFDTSVFHDMQLNLADLLKVSPTAENPLELFKDNWQEKITIFIKQSAKVTYSQIKTLPLEEKKKIVQDLYQHGLFNYKQAALYIAKQLGVSRATVYSYLKN